MTYIHQEQKRGVQTIVILMKDHLQIDRTDPQLDHAAHQSHDLETDDIPNPSFDIPISELRSILLMTSTVFDAEESKMLLK